MLQPIAITGSASISALGNTSEKAYSHARHYLSYDNDLEAWVGKLPAILISDIEAIRGENRNYLSLDPTVLYAIYVSRQAINNAGWKKGEEFGINIGSSRGATQLFEKYFSAFAKNKKSSTLASPTTTLGNISSWVAQDLQNEGPEISHSITCSTALHALLNGVAWLQAGMSSRFLIGGSEAALTPFTIAQMQAMKTYSRATKKTAYPCQSFDLEKTENTMVLGEGASSICLEIGKNKKALAYITGVGYATEKLKHAVSISAEATCFQKSMQMALGDNHPSEVDAIIMHAPGTIVGDSTEYKAIQKIFKENLPLLTTNKWKLGHTFGASGLLSLDLGIYMLQNQDFVPVPFISPQGNKKPLQNILINAVGFGGNAVSILLSKA